VKINEPPSFSQLVDVHTELEDVFLLHQEALTLLDFDAALELLEIHWQLLLCHMRHEEELLLPVFDRAGPVKKWPRVLYTGQHEKMRGMLEHIRESASELCRERPLRPRRSVIRLLDYETTYKHLVEHHEGAERDGLFPIADSVATPEERRELLERFAREWEDATAVHTARLNELRQRLEADMDWS
jgi:hemerythrin-like domain-containing protein